MGESSGDEVAQEDATDIRLAMTSAMRRAMALKPDEFDPRKFLGAALAAARDLCAERFETFGCAGMASRLLRPGLH